MPLDAGTVHRFTMLERAVRSLVKQGRFEDSLKLLEEMFGIAPQDAGLSKLKARLAADLIKKAAQAQKIAAATSIVQLVDAKVPAAHLGAQEKDLLAKAKTDLYSLCGAALSRRGGLSMAMARDLSSADYARDLNLQRKEKDYYFQTDPDSPIPPEIRSKFPGLSYFPPYA